MLHYLGHVPVETITEWFGDPTEELEVRLDAGFDALVAILDWPDDADDAGRPEPVRATPTTGRPRRWKAAHSASATRSPSRHRRWCSAARR